MNLPGGDRRSFLRAGATVGAAAAGIPLLTGSASAWNGMDIEVGCECQRKLAFIRVDQHGRDEFGDGDHYVFPGHGITYEGKTDDEYAFSTPQGPATVELTPDHRDGDIVSFSYDTNGVPVSRLLVDTNFLVLDAYYDDVPFTDTKRVRQTPIVRDTDLAVDHRAHEEVWFLKIYYCTTLEVRVTGTYNSDDPTEQIDPTDDEIAFGIWSEPRHHDDQHVFDNGVAPTNGNGGIHGDELVFHFPVQEAYVDDPAAVSDPERMKAEVLIKDGDGRRRGESDGEFWAGETSFPLA